MKILFDGRVLKHKCVTGVERYATEILSALQHEGVNIKVGIPPMNNRFFHHLWENINLYNAASGFDILFCPANIAPIRRLSKTKLVVTLHDIGFLEFKDAFSSLFYNYYKFSIPIILKNADRVITVSEHEQKHIESTYPFSKGKVVTIWNGIGNSPGVSYHATAKDKYILYVGSLSARKNLSGLVKAFSDVLDTIDHKLVIVGASGHLHSKDMELLNILRRIPRDRIEIKGYVKNDELIELYRKASLFVFPSFYEGFGFTPLEAMSHGCPVLTSNRTSLPEICGDAAYYVNPYDIHDISQGIVKILTNNQLSLNLIRNGLERVKLFSWQTCARKHIEVFSDVLKK